MRVVIADDVEDIRLLVRVALTSSGAFDVVAEAADGEEVVDLTREHQPDLVVLDLSMPRMDGLEALPHILRAAPAARVVVLSGHDGREVRAAALHQLIGTRPA